MRKPKNIHYGNERNANTTRVDKYPIDGHSVSLWSDGNLTCNCKGWIFKKLGKKRECWHVRVVYAQLTHSPIPDKTVPTIESKIENMVDRIIKQLTNK